MHYTFDANRYLANELDRWLTLEGRKRQARARAKAVRQAARRMEASAGLVFALFLGTVTTVTGILSAL